MADDRCRGTAGWRRWVATSQRPSLPSARLTHFWALARRSDGLQLYVSRRNAVDERTVCDLWIVCACEIRGNLDLGKLGHVI
jgi:hypothetical protein